MSTRIPQAFIDELINRVDIVTVIDARVPLKKMGANYKACCPFHSDKTPSFTVSSSKQFYHCFGCGASGNVISFLLAYDQLTFIEALETLAGLCGLTLPIQPESQVARVADSSLLYTALAAASQFYQWQLPQHTVAISYLKTRGLSAEITQRFALGYAPAGWDTLSKNLPEFTVETLTKAGLLIAKEHGEHYDRFRQRIMLPIRDRRGRILGFGGRVISHEVEPKYLNSPETPVFHKRSILYGLYEILQARVDPSMLLVVEGYMDVVALAQYGIDYAVATLGTATSAEHIQLILRYTQHIVFCFDGDTPGRAAAWKALQTLLPWLTDGVQAEFLFLPSNEDPDSLVRKEGKIAFEQRINAATPFAQYLFSHLQETVDTRGLAGQAKLAHVAAPLLKQIPGVLLRHKLLEELAYLTKLAIADLSALTGIKLPVVVRRSKRHSWENTQNRSSLMQQAITLLLQQPQLAQEITDLTPWKNLTMPGAIIFLKLLELLKKTPNLTTGALLESWRDDPVFSHLKRLSCRELLISKAGLTTEFHAILKKLLNNEQAQLIESLQRKAEQNCLSALERQQYVALLQQQASKPNLD